MEIISKYKSKPEVFIVKQVKDFAEEFAYRCLERGDISNLTGFWDLMKEKHYNKFKNENI